MTRALAVVLALAAGGGQSERPAPSGVEGHPASGLVLHVDPARRAFAASIDAIPGYMAAMAMTFEVRDARELDGLAPGVAVEFTIVAGRGRPRAESIRVRPYQGVEPAPLTARRLALFRDVAGGQPVTPVPVGAVVPDFTLTDQKSRRVVFSRLRGSVVAINFTYTTCQQPDFCVRLVNHFGVLQKRFAGQLGVDLALLTISFDPIRDQPDVLDRYAAEWKANPDGWRFLTGPASQVRRVLGFFGMAAFPDDGQMDHTLRTAIVDRRGALVAVVEGNGYSSDQLVDLVRSVLDARPAGPGRK